MNKILKFIPFRLVITVFGLCLISNDFYHSIPNIGQKVRVTKRPDFGRIVFDF